MENDKLFQLIKSLTKKEKGYFKKYYSGTNEEGDNNHWLLFNAMDKAENYDEVDILTKVYHPFLRKVYHPFSFKPSH